MQPTTRPISPNKKVLVAIRFVFFIRWSSAVDSPTDQTHDGHSKQVCRCGDPLIHPTIPPRPHYAGARQARTYCRSADYVRTAEVWYGLAKEIALHLVAA